MALTKAKASNILLTTPAASSNDVTPATTEYVTTALANLVDSAPSTLNTLNELAAALGDDANFSTTVTNSIAGKLPLAGGTMTGNIAHASDFTIDAGGNITLNAAGDIILDADGDDWKFHEGGTAVFEIKHESHGVDFLLNTGNEDWRFKGSDDGTTITALHLDMSDAGTATFNHDVDVTGELYVGTQNSVFAENVLRFKSSGAAYIDHNTTGQNINFRVSNSSALDTTPLILYSNGNALFSGGVEAGTAGFTAQDHRMPAGAGYITYAPSNGATDTLTVRKYGTVQQKFDQYGVQFPGSTRVSIGNSNNAEVMLHLGTDSSNSNIGYIRMEGYNASEGNIYKDSTYAIRMDTASNNAPIRIDGSQLVLGMSGNVGIGETSPLGKLHIKGTDVGASPASTANQLVLEDTENGLSILSAAAGAGYINFGDSGDNAKGGFIYDHSADAMRHIANGGEKMRVTSTGLHTTGGLHEIHSSNPNNFVAGCAADTWHDLTNYNYQNAHNGPGVDNTAQTITQVVWQNNSSSLGYIVRVYVIHGAYSANTHTIYSSAGTASVLDAGSSFCHIYPSKYDTAGNGGLVYATLHTSSTTLKIGVRFNNHTGTPYSPLTMQIKTNGPPAAGVSAPTMRVWRL